MEQTDPTRGADDLSEKIIQGLQEYDAAEFVQQVVAFVGKDRALGFYQQALMVENSGGMLTSWRDRRRTPGGVFFTLVRNNLSDIERELLFPSGRLSLPESYVLEQIQRFSLLQLEIGVGRIEHCLNEKRTWDNSRRTTLLAIKQLLLKKIELEKKLDEAKTVAAQSTRVKLKQNLSAAFSDAELREICFDLGIDYDEIQRENKREFVVELIMHFERRGRLSELVNACRQLRPNLSW